MSRSKSDALFDAADILGAPITAEQVDGYLRLLADVSDADFCRAIDIHLNDPVKGMFFPKPADIRARLPRVNAHPHADAAWAIAVKSMDEDETVVWTDEIAEAFGVAKMIYDVDKVGARMAFRAAYEQIISTRQGSPKWIVSIGSDVAGRTDAIRNAEVAGLITAKQASNLLPPPESPVGERLLQITQFSNVIPWPKDRSDSAENQKNRERLAEVREAALNGVKRRKENFEKDKLARKEQEEQRRNELIEQARKLSVGR